MQPPIVTQATLAYTTDTHDLILALATWLGLSYSETVQTLMGVGATYVCGRDLGVVEDAAGVLLDPMFQVSVWEQWLARQQP